MASRNLPYKINLLVYICRLCTRFAAPWKEKQNRKEKKILKNSNPFCKILSLSARLNYIFCWHHLEVFCVTGHKYLFTKQFSYHFGNLFYTVLINFDILHSCFIYKNNIFFLIRHYGGGTICLRESCIHGIFFFFKILLKLKIETLRLHIRANVGMHQVMIFKIVL